MQNNQNIGCVGFLGILIFIAFVWKAILYIGVPVAIVGAIVAAYLFDAAKNDEHDDGTTRGLGVLVAAASAVLFIASVAGNIFTEDGPFGNPEEAERKTASAATHDDFMAESPREKMISACTNAILPAGGGAFDGILSGSPYDEAVSENSDGTTSVLLTRRKINEGMCPNKLTGSCVMRGDQVVSISALRDDGFFGC